ncbi:MAG: hypothetical protein JSW50_15840 [Candidatus Latescibacterota bacterium]|nr:MAG: hypothetical protein JSW50_15840 [Candidatus Latescibacterota bacterium]
MPLLLIGSAAKSAPSSEKDPKDKRKKRKDEEKKEEGKLGEFEKEATDGEAKVEKENQTTLDDIESFIEFVETTAEVIEALSPVLEVMALGGEWSWVRISRVNDPSFPDILKRLPGETVLPFINFEIGYQDVEPNVEAVDARVELGYGPLAIQFRETHYEERNPFDRLDIIQWHVLYRMWYPRFFEIDIGLGSTIIHGDNTDSGFSLTLPIRVQPLWWACMQFRPSVSSINGNPINQLDVGISIGPRHMNIRAGYRWVTSGRVSLNGPFFGVAFCF